MLTQLAEVFLDSHQQMLTEFRPAVGKMIVLTCDGLTNVNHESVFNLMICSPFPFFFASFHLNGAEESAEQLLRQLRCAKSQLEVELVHNNIGANQFIRPPNNANNHNGDIVHPPNNANNNAVLPPNNNNAVRVANGNIFNANDDPILRTASENWKMFFGLCTDNPNVMRKVRKTLMEQSKDTLWICYGCPCHALNSLVGDMLKKRPFRKILQYDHLHFVYFCSILRSSINVVSYFRRCHRAQDYLKLQMQLLLVLAFVLVLFSKTRWNSALFMWARLIKAKSPLRSLLIFDVPQGNCFSGFA